MNASLKYDPRGRTAVDMRSDFRADRPLHLELATVERIYTSLELTNPTCLAIGMPNPFGVVLLQELGGYWSAVAATNRQLEEGGQVLDDEPLAMGLGGELPYEDKQFDLVVLARGTLTGDARHDQMVIQECHRILKPPGYLVLTADYRKRLDLVRLVSHSSIAAGSYNEQELFELLKRGFDVLSLRTNCRFWMQLTRQLLGRGERSKGRATAALYWLANQLDLLLFFTKGYQMVAYGRRKGWRERQSLGRCHGVALSDALLKRTRN